MGLSLSISALAKTNPFAWGWDWCGASGLIEFEFIGAVILVVTPALVVADESGTGRLILKFLLILLEI